jgi:hypothetical protein
MYRTFVALVASVSAAANPGIGISITQAGLDNARNVAVPLVFENIKDVHVDEVDFSGGKFTNIDVHIPAPSSVDDVAINLESSTNSMELAANGLEIDVTADFVFKKIITVKG